MSAFTHERPAFAGERQSVERVTHPRRGDCWLVFDNGPTMLGAIDGETLPVRICCSGASKEGRWTEVDDPEHGRMRCVVTAHGPTHRKYWSEMLGDGWLVDERLLDRHMDSRFDMANGSTFRFGWTQIAVGTPDYAAKMRRSTRCAEPSPEEGQWITLTTTRGEVLAFRRGGPPPKSDAPEVAQRPLFGGGT